MTENEAKQYIESYATMEIEKVPISMEQAFDVAIKALEEVQQYRQIGTVEELQKAEKEENILKFYYCNSEDSYLIGRRVGNFYYAHYFGGSWVFDMSRYLPWGETVNGYTFPSEPIEINFSEWLNGFIKNECGGTVEECRATVEKQTEKKVTTNHSWTHYHFYCPICKAEVNGMKYCPNCGQKLIGVMWNE